MESQIQRSKMTEARTLITEARLHQAAQKKLLKEAVDKLDEARTQGELGDKIITKAQAIIDDLRVPNN